MDRDIIVIEPKRKSGRPRKPRPERPQAYQIEVWDRRPELKSPRLVLTDYLIPGNWTIKDIIERLGVAPHLTVTRRLPGENWTTIQHGRTA